MKKILLKTILALVLFGTSFNLNAQCQASFTYTNTGATYNFTNTSNPGAGTILQTIWNFGDGGSSTLLNDSHTYTSCGTYTISLTIITSSFCTSTITDSVAVSLPVNGSFTANVDTTNGNTTFTASPTSLNYNYFWSFGDASTGQGIATTHQYASSGTYNVCLIISDQNGVCSDTVCNPVIVNIVNPTCAVTFTSQALGGVLAFTPSPLNPLDTYIWNYGDGSPKDTTLLGNHSYTASGTYTVCVTVITLQGCSNMYCQPVTVTLTSVDELSASSIKIYPNPTSALVNVEGISEKGNTELIVKDLSGRKIIQQSVSGSNQTGIDVSQLENGMYLLELRSEKQLLTKTFIKK